jgi:hypothetical protein
MSKSQSSLLWSLSLLFLVNTPVAVTAIEATQLLPMTLGKKYSGTLTPSSTNPQGEVCYQLAIKPNTRITLNVKTDGVGILKFAVYDRSKALRFFHNDVNNPQSKNRENPNTSRFSFPIISDASQLCLTTSNPNNGQQYDLTVTGKSNPTNKPQLALRPAYNKQLTAQAQPTPKPSAPPTPTPTKPPVAGPPTVDIPPAPTGEPYCYVGTWQIANLSAYWVPTIQTYTQGKVADPQTVGYAKVTLNRDGNAYFEAFDFEQRYTLKKSTGARIDRISFGLTGNASARFQSNPDSTLTFNSQGYQRLTNRLNLGANIKLTGEKLFIIFGDRDAPQPSYLIVVSIGITSSSASPHPQVKGSCRFHSNGLIEKVYG